MGAMPKVRSFSSAEVDLVLLVKGEEVYLGVAENFSFNEEYNAELQRAIGSFHPIASLVHGASGSFSWGGALSSMDLIDEGVLPDVSNLGGWEPFTLQVVDSRREELICQLEGCVLNTRGGNLTENSKLMENVSGLCQRVKHPSELN